MFLAITRFRGSTGPMGTTGCLVVEKATAEKRRAQARHAHRRAIAAEPIIAEPHRKDIVGADFIDDQPEGRAWERFPFIPFLPHPTLKRFSPGEMKWHRNVRLIGRTGLQTRPGRLRRAVLPNHWRLT